MDSKSKYNFRKILVLSGVIVLVMFAISGYVWTQIPSGEQVCTHWNAAGECDGYGSKFVGIFLMPIVAAGMVGLFVLIPRIDPRATNIAQSSKAYTTVWGMLLVFFLVFHSILMLEILGYDAKIGSTLPALVGAIFVVIGSVLGKVRSNFFFGIRTPWTLSSDLSWEKTHRLGGKLFVLQGLLSIAGALIFPGEIWITVLVGGILLIVTLLAIYSYVIWKDDPNARTLGA